MEDEASPPKQIDFEKGSQVKNKAGLVGTISGSELFEGEKYVRIKFPEYESLIKKDQIGNVFSPFSGQEAPLITPQPVIDKITDEGKVNALKNYIHEHQTYTTEAFRFEGLTEAQLKTLELVLQEAREHNYLFRAEARHPYAKGKYDKEEGFKRGPFQEGFKVEGTHFDWKVYLTADPDIAMQYPDINQIPLNWDGSSYVYIVDPSSIYSNPKDIDTKDFRYNEVGISHDIPFSDVKYVIERKAVDKNTYASIGGRKDRMVRILKNEPKTPK